MSAEDKKKIIGLLMQKNYMVSPEIIPLLNDISDYDSFLNKLNNIEKNKISKIFTKNDFYSLIKTNEIENKEEQFCELNLKVLSCYNEKPIKREIQHFVSYFKKRYDTLRKILQNRPELQSVLSIKRIGQKEQSEKVELIGLVNEIKVSRNGNYFLDVEDVTGNIKVIVTKKNKDAFEKVKDIIPDEVIGITGTASQDVVFVNDIIFPDIPLNKEFKKCKDDVCVAFLSDLHVGSDCFLEKEFNRFISWINLESGTEEQKELAKKVKYIFIIGDLVDGVGIYPDQDKDLTIKDVYEQYEECAKLLSKIRKDIKIIVCGGNHDALRLAEPQPVLSELYAKQFYEMDNLVVVSNPACVNIHKSEDFPGFDVLMYHGFSFDYYVSNVSSIRNNGGYDSADLIMSFLLKKRHLAPAHTSTLYVPDEDCDPLVINKVPDFFVTGHIHKAKIGIYKNVSLISCSCWQPMTDFQEKVGHSPEPCKVPIVNLKTRKINIMDFENDSSK